MGSENRTDAMSDTPRNLRDMPSASVFVRLYRCVVISVYAPQKTCLRVYGYRIVTLGASHGDCNLSLSSTHFRSMPSKIFSFDESLGAFSAVESGATVVEVVEVISVETVDGALEGAGDNLLSDEPADEDAI